MPPTAPASVRYLRRRLAGPAAADGDLVRRFAGRRDEAAFAELVDRHGPMVLGWPGGRPGTIRPPRT